MNDRLAAEAATIVSGNALDVMLPDVATNVYAALALLIEMPANVAMPFTAATDTVPFSVPPDGLDPNARVTGPVKVVASAPCASFACTTMEANAAPAVAVAGNPEITSDAAAPPTAPVAVAPMLNDAPPIDAVIVCAPRVAPSVHVVPAWPSALVVPVSGATEPPPVATANVTVTPETEFPKVSVTFTITCCGNTEPTLPDWLPPLNSDTVVGAAGVTLNDPLAPPLSPAMLGAS